MSGYTEQRRLLAQDADTAMGTFITLEGCDGAGKTTQAALLAATLHGHGVGVVPLREPGGTDLGDFIYSYVRQQTSQSAQQGFFSELGSPGFPGKVAPIPELFLFAAARAQLVTEVIQPALERGDIVLSDRYVDSTTAYQGYGRGLPLEEVAQINAIATRGIMPDLTILLDIDPAEGLARVPRKQDRMESEFKRFENRVRDGYSAIAASEPNRVYVLDATLPQNEIQARIWERVCGLLSIEPSAAQPVERLF